MCKMPIWLGRALNCQCVSDVNLCSCYSCDDIMVVVVNLASFSFIILQTRNFPFIRLDCASSFTHRTSLIVIILLYYMTVCYAYIWMCLPQSIVERRIYNISMKSNCIIHHLPPFTLMVLTNYYYYYCFFFRYHTFAADELLHSISCYLLFLPLLHLLFVLHLIRTRLHTKQRTVFVFFSLYGLSIFDSSIQDTSTNSSSLSVRLIVEAICLNWWLLWCFICFAFFCILFLSFFFPLCSAVLFSFTKTKCSPWFSFIQSHWKILNRSLASKVDSWKSYAFCSVSSVFMCIYFLLLFFFHLSFFIRSIELVL